MTADNSSEQSPPQRATFGELAKRVALFLLFGTILVIPRIRRLRRRVWAWTCVRLFLAAGGAWLIWRYSHARLGTAGLIGGLILLALSLLLRSKPLVKSVDTLAHDLGALIVLNGGTFRESASSAAIRQTQIFVQSERIVVMGPREHRLLEIPLAKVRSLSAQPLNRGSAGASEFWEVRVEWVAEQLRTTTFQYEGVFAEHLAQVTESTLRSEWKKDLPVIQLVKGNLA